MHGLSGRIQPYAWGSPTAIPEFLGTEPTGDPQAELWLGAHPSAPAEVDGRPLDAAIDSDPAGWVGAGAVERFGPRLPYLVKLLAAAQPLSLQAHPNRAQAEEGYAREESAGIARDAAERTYRDDWPKPEALCALGDFHALCGFREPSQTYALFAALGVPAAVDLVAPLQSGGAADLEQVFGRLLRMADAAPLVEQVIAAAKNHIHDQDELGDFARTACEVDAFYPGDPGVLAALIMNRVVLRRNEALYLPAGNLHAYLRGTGVEIMANSDNVLRGGLTAKHIDVDELLRLLDFTPGWAGPVPVVEESPGVHRYRTPAPEFALWRLEADHDPVVPAGDLGRIVLVAAGSPTLRSGSGELALTRGRSAFLRPDETVTVSGSGTAFVGSTGQPGAEA
jgi:mannose-6-phosphate isomerase